jgi:N-acetylneuraminate synthase/sialic acid synthase
MTSAKNPSTRSFTIGSVTITDDSPAYVVAEIGANHQGDVETAKQMIRAAAAAGADAVKFQKRDNQALFTTEAYNAPYASENAFGATYGEHREALEFGKDEYLELIAESAANKVEFFATPWDFPSVDFLEDLDVPAYKVASCDLTNTPLLRYIASMKRPTIISTGGGTLEAVDRAVEVVLSAGTPLTVMQCTSGYPPRFDELNLSVITTFRERYPEATIGYSGHDSGIAMGLVAYVLGARVIEKHFTLNRAMKGTDHAFSLEPDGLRKMVRDLRRAREALGDGVKRAYESESAPLKKLSKMIVAKNDLAKGHVLSEADFDYRSPGHGIAPADVHLLVGKGLNRDVAALTPILEEDVA